MSFEAVPCMFRSTATDGNSSSYIGLLIRPSSSTTAPQGQTPSVIPSTVGAASNVPKSLHVVPSNLLKGASSNQAAKVVVPSGVQLRLQPTTCSAPQCSDTWMQTAPRSNISATFDSPSPSQVVPQMNVGDSYECAMPCASSSSFFPPISSLTQGLSSGKSDIDLLQDISPVDMNSLRSQKMSSVNNAGDYSHRLNQSVGYQSSSLQNSYPSQVLVEMPTGRVPSCRYQSGYNGANDCSATPDSGIQSIAGSPPSAGPFTPPMPSPAPFIATVQAMNDVANMTSHPSLNSDDFSDMPRLIPFHQMEEAGSPVGEDAPQMIYATKSETAEVRDTEEKMELSRIAISPAMNVTDFVEQIMSQMDPEQRKEFANAIKSKVVTEDSPVCFSQNKEQEAESSTNADLTKESVSSENQIKRKTRRRKTQSNDNVHCQETTSTERYKTRMVNRKNKKDTPENETNVKQKESRKRKRERIEEEEREKKRKKEESLAREEKERLIKRIAEERKKDELRIEEERVLEEKRKAVEENAERELKRQMEEQKNVEAMRKIEQEDREKLREYRQCVKKQISEQLNLVLERVGKQMKDLQLGLGSPVHWQMPWYSLNWKDVTQRIIERNRIERLAKEKSAASRAECQAANRKASKRTSVSKTEPLQLSVSPSASGVPEKEWNDQLFTKIKQNVIVDVCPRVDQIPCVCKTGCCSEEDECLNRMIQMECSSNCPRGNQCTNRRISKHEGTPKLKLYETTNGCGMGVKAMEKIDKGQFVCEYVGEVISTERLERRNKGIYRHSKNHYALSLCPGYVIDAHQKGNIGRFINHSCDPNCSVQRWSVKGMHRIGLFALRTINKDEQITYDYNWDAFGFNGVTPCFCGSPCCRRFINKNLLMTSREKDFARKNNLLLLRNVRKSADQKILAAKGRPRNSEKDAKAEYLGALRSYSNDALDILASQEILPKKQMKQLRSSLAASLSPPTSLKFEIAVEAVENGLREAFEEVVRQVDRKKIESLKLKFGANKTKHMESLKKFGRLPDSFEDRPSSAKPRRHAHRILTATADLAYLESGVPVGSYDPDSTFELHAIEADSDYVRCLCGITDDDGSMIQCDRCHFWLHDDCVVTKKPFGKNVKFICEMCKMHTQRTPVVDIVLRSQPDIKFEGCTYYRTLVNIRHIQVRIFESVYLQKPENDNHKVVLKRLTEESKSTGKSVADSVMDYQQKIIAAEQSFMFGEFKRADLCCFRVERLFATPEGHRFVFGFYYARPHEVYCEPGRMFHRKELFATPMFDTLPLDAVVGRCLVLEPRVYSLGRPRMPRFKEEDVYFCEYQQTGKNSRYFEKIPARNHYYINTEIHNFNRFPNELAITRTFTPFVMEERPEARGGRSRSVRHRTVVSPSSTVQSSTLKDKSRRLETLIQPLFEKNGAKTGSCAAHSNSRSPSRKRSLPA